MAFEADYKIFYASTENDVHITRNLIGAFRDAQVDGYIIAPPLGVEKDVEALLNEGLPVVLFDRYFTDLPTHTVTINNYKGAYDAVMHFIGNGYSNIGFITLTSAQTQMADRLSGYLQAVEENGLTASVLKVAYHSAAETMVGNITAFMKQHPELDAILFATNYLAVSGLEAIAGLQKRVPDEIAVISYDDNSHFSLFSPSITAVAQPVQAISEHIVKVLLSNLMQPPKTETLQKVVLETELVIRQSSAAATVAATKSACQKRKGK